MNTFTINKIRYEAVPFDFNAVCDLEDMGITMGDMQKKSMATIRAYLALCMPQRDLAIAGEEMQAHIIGGGVIDELVAAMGKEMSESDFFRALNKNSKKNTSARKKQTSEEETES